MSVIYKANVRLPCTDDPVENSQWPRLTEDDYRCRIDRLLTAIDESFTHMIFYGDREHFSNIEYLTGYDPRFEEALLIIDRVTQQPMLIVGNEGWDYADKIPYRIRKRRYTSFSLPNQPYNELPTLQLLFSEAGIERGSKVALFGWKLFARNEQERVRMHDMPYYLVQTLADIVGHDQLYTMNHLMIADGLGLRETLEAKELVLAEINGTRASRAVLNALSALRVGMSELDASANLGIDGYPLSIHPNVNFGERAFLGLASPEAQNVLAEGDIVCVGMGYRRALCHKVGLYVKDPSQVPKASDDVFRRYFSALTAWYENLDIGVTGGDVYKAIVRAVGDLERFGIGLNPGHAIHTEEWINSPFYKDSRAIIHSGMLLQCDFSVFLPEQNIAVHAEDGVIVADEQMQEEILRVSPASYARMRKRQKFMRDTLGIRVRDGVFPTSDMPAVIFPCMMDLECVYANA